MPYELVGDSIEKGLKDKLKIIKRLLKTSNKSEDTDAKGVWYKTVKFGSDAKVDKMNYLSWFIAIGTKNSKMFFSRC